MFRFLFIFIIFLSSFSFESFSQCDERDQIFKCSQIFGDSITFLNDFEVDQPKRKSLEDPNGTEWDIYLMKGTEYRFALCCLSVTDKVMRLYDGTVTEDLPYGSTNNKGSKNRYFDFICKKSGVYKVSIRFNKNTILGEELSALGILGFIRKVHI